MQRLREHFRAPVAFPFDWWNTPIDGLTRFLRDWDLDRLYDPGALRVRHKLFQPSWIENREYGIGLVHEFPRDRLSHLLGRYRDHIETPKSRTAHLMRKFDKLNNPAWSVLFVRNLSRDEEADPRACEQLREAVLGRVPKAKSQFVLISRSALEAPGWIPLRIDDPSKEPWSGDPAVWDPALASLGFRVERPDGRAGLPPPGKVEGQRKRPQSEAMAARAAFEAPQSS
jgi:hypothetical protein